MKFGYVVPKIYVQTDRQTDRHTDIYTLTTVSRYVYLRRGVTRRCRPSTYQSSFPSYCMRPVLGPDLLPRLIDSNSQHPLCGFCSSDTPPFQELLRTSDKQLFGRIIHNQHHLLYNYLPAPSIASQNYDLRPCTHNSQLPAYSGHLTDSNFFICLLYNNIY